MSSTRCGVTVLVIDASVLSSALLTNVVGGNAVRRRLMGERLLAPQLIDLEVASSWRRLVAAGQLSQAEAQLAIGDLGTFALRRVSHPWLLERCWELRHNLTIYDAIYVALAEAYQAVLLTADQRLAGAPGPRCEIEVLKDS